MVCDATNGTCVAETSIAYASPGGSDTADCSATAPCSITHAFAVANLARDTVKLLPGTYLATITVNDRSLKVHGAGATVTAGTGNTFTINDAGHLAFFGVTIVASGMSGGGIGIDCESLNHTDFPSLSLEGVTVDATAQAVYVAECSATGSRSRLHMRSSGSAGYVFLANAGATATLDRTLFDGGDGIASIGSQVRITNSVIANQTGPDGAANGVGGGVVWISYSTVYDSHLKCGSSTASCAGSSLSGVCIDNSIIYNSAGTPADTVSGIGCTVEFSLVSPQTTAPTGANNKLGVSPLLVDPTTLDFHLQPTSPAIDAADPIVPGTADYDGTPRPVGSRSDMGALEYKP